MQVNVANSIIGKENIVNTQEKTSEVWKNSSVQAPFGDNDVFVENSLEDRKVTYSKADNEKETHNEKTETFDARELLTALEALNEMVTDEDYNQLEELGIIPDQENPELTIGVYERIQMQLAAYCEDYNSAGLNINKEKLSRILGSKAFAAAVEKALSLKDMEPGRQAAVIEDEKKPTIDNVYEKAYSSNAVSVKGISEISDEAWKELETQVEKILDKAGIELTKENKDIAKWMISYNIPLTKENIVKAIDIKEVFSLSTEDYNNVISQNISMSIYFTGAAGQAQLSTKQYDMTDVYEAMETVEKVSDEAVAAIVKDEKVLNIANLKRYNEAMLEKGKKAEEPDEVSNSKFIAAKRVIIEARVIMSAPVMLKVKQYGVNINFAELTDVLEKISEIEADEAEKYLNSANAEISEDNIKAFVETNRAVMDIKMSSVAMIAAVEDSDTLNTVRNKAVNYAIHTYETVFTSIRKDLGDSYDKAFENIDSLLEGIDMENTEENRRAVRILGYNSMEISEENINTIKVAAARLDYLVENLTPKTVSYLIANNINPMNRDIKSLNDELAQINEELGVKAENFAEYLWNLDKANGITKEDREKFITLYRSLKEITKKDMRALGAAIDSGYELTMENLLAAARSRKVTGDAVAGRKSDESYTAYKMQQIKESGVVTEDEVNELIKSHITITPKNIKNTKELRSGNKAFDKLLSRSRGKIKDKLLSLIEADSEEELKASYEELKDEAANELKEEMHSPSPIYANIETALDNNGMIKLMNEYAKNDSYYIPVEINGSVTNIHLTIKSGEMSSSVSVDIKEWDLGALHLEMIKEEDALKGILVYENVSMNENINRLAKEYTLRLKRENITVDVFNVANSETYRSRVVDKTSDKTDTKELYRVAKIFIETVGSYEISKNDR